MKIRILLALCALAVLAGCNPQKTYYDADLSVAADNERSGRYEEAHQNLVSAVWRAKNHLSPKDVSTAYYNLGTFYRRTSHFTESVSALLESIAYAEKSNAFDQLAMGRRYIELAISYAELDQWQAGIPYLEKMLPYKDSYSGNEARTVDTVYTEYEKAMASRGLSATFVPDQQTKPTP